MPRPSITQSHGLADNFLEFRDQEERPQDSDQIVNLGMLVCGFPGLDAGLDDFKRGLSNTGFIVPWMLPGQQLGKCLWFKAARGCFGKRVRMR